MRTLLLLTLALALPSLVEELCGEWDARKREDSEAALLVGE